MNKKHVLPALIILALSFGFILSGIAKWSADTKNAKVDFVLPTEPHKLSFSGLTADIVFDAADLKHSEIIARIDVSTLATEDLGLTKHLLSADFLDADKFPQIKFISSRIEKTGEGYTAYGALAMKDSVHAVAIPFTFDQVGKKGTFKGKFSIFSGDYGVMKKSKSGKDQVDITLEIPVNRSK